MSDLLAAAPLLALPVCMALLVAVCACTDEGDYR